MNNVLLTSAKGTRQGGIGLKGTLDEDIFTNVIYYSEFADGRKYVGQTTQGFLKRYKGHLQANKPTHYDNVLKAHMDEAVIYPICFGVEDIEDVDTQDLLNGLEVAEIMLRETFNDVDPEHGLNHTTGGYSYEVSEATKDKISKTQKENYVNLSDEEKERRAKISSENMKGNKNALGYKHTEEAKQKQRDYWDSEEGQKTKEKLSQRNNNYWTEEKREQKRNEMFERYNYDINIEDIKKMINDGLNNKELAEQIGCSSLSLNNLLKTRGLPSMKQLRNNGKTHWVKNNEDKYNVDKTSAGYRIREKNHTTILSKINNEERANELCNMLNNNELTLKELRKMKLKGQI